MNILRTLKMRLLPPSSRSFHEAKDATLQQLDRIEDSINNSATTIETLEKQIQKLQMDVRTQSEHQKIYLKEIYRLQANLNTAREAQLQFFRNIPEAKGDIRLVQLATAKLAFELKKICEDNGLTYWPWAGSAVAMTSRNGSIPWDDDFDVVMTREDFNKLIFLVNKSNQFQISLVYDAFVTCKQYRFSEKNPLNPCFVDIVPLDWVSSSSQETDNRLKAINSDYKQELTEKLYGSLSYWKNNPLLFSPDSGDVVEPFPVNRSKQELEPALQTIKGIEDTLAKYRARAIEEGIFCSKKEAKALGFGFECYTGGSCQPLVFSQKIFFPATKNIYEGFELFDYAQPEKMCDLLYPGWPFLGNDMLTLSHFPKEYLDKEGVREYLLKTISTDNQGEAFV